MDNQSFKALKDKWYAKLKKSGFDDIEKETSDTLRGDNPIRNAVPRRDGSQGRDGGPWEAKADYYRYAHHFLNEYRFATRLDAIVWEYHSEGISIRDIVETLNKTRKKKVYRRLVWTIVDSLRNEMKKLYGIR